MGRPRGLKTRQHFDRRLYHSAAKLVQWWLSSRKLINLNLTAEPTEERGYFLNSLHWFENCRVEALIIEDIDWPYGHWRCPLHADDYHDEVEINICSGIISLIQFHASMRTDITLSGRVPSRLERKLWQKFGRINCSAGPRDTALCCPGQQWNSVKLYTLNENLWRFKFYYGVHLGISN